MTQGLLIAKPPFISEKSLLTPCYYIGQAVCRFLLCPGSPGKLWSDCSPTCRSRDQTLDLSDKYGRGHPRGVIAVEDLDHSIFMKSLPVKTFPAKKIAQIILLVALCAYIAGIAGVLTIFLMLWMTRQSFAVDCHEKHGISHQSASRLGGLAVFFCAILTCWISVGMDLSVESFGERLTATPVTCAILIGVIGLWDDTRGELSPALRITLSAILFSACLLLNPDYIPSTIGIPLIDDLLKFWPAAFVLCVVACIAILNATNMADGANGLMPLVFLGAFYSFFQISAEPVYFAVTAGLAVFALFNVLSGKLFLGDVGSYGLGTLAVLSAIKITSGNDAEVWFFLCLTAYPVIDFFASFIRRKHAGRSPLAPDNDHLHNRLYEYLRRFLSSPLAANSISGLIISITTTGVAVLLLNWWNAYSNYWIALFAGQIAVYLIAFYALPTNQASARTQTSQL